MNRLLRVCRRTPLTPRMVRLTLGGGDGLAGYPGAGPDRRIKMFFPPPGSGRAPALPRASSGGPVWAAGVPRPVIRTYTVRRFDEQAGELDVDFVLHGGRGPAATWAAGASIGDEVGVSDPGGRYAPDPTVDWQLLAGDESALPAIGTVLAALSSAAPVDVFVEVADTAEEQPLPAPAQARVHWLHRAGAPPGARLVAAVRAAALGGGRGQAWVSAEASAVRELRGHLLADRGMPRRLVYPTNYWRATG